MLRLTRCPSFYVPADAAEVLRAWTMLRLTRTWPRAGGTEDQAAVFVEAVRYLETLRAQHEEEEAAKARAMRGR